MANAVCYDRAFVHGRLVKIRTPAIANPASSEQVRAHGASPVTL